MKFSSCLSVRLLIMIAMISCCTALVQPERPFRTHISNLECTSSSPITSTSPPDIPSRRSLLSATIGLFLAVPAEAALAAATEIASDNDEALKRAEAERAKERMAQRIAESKSKYRKPTDLVKERKDNTDYSCVASTGSPCPEGLVPMSVQRELIGVLQKME